MKHSTVACIILFVMVLMSSSQEFSLGHSSPVTSAIVSAGSSGPAAARLEIWNPDVRSSNITSTTLFPFGSQFQIRVNLTTSEQISGFDITLNYNITDDVNILQAVRTGTELDGGLFDPNRQPAGCSVFAVRNQIDLPPGRIRIAAVFLGGCTATGTGTLFSIMFRVVGTGVGFIDIVRTSSSGRIASGVNAGPPNFASIPIFPVDARFQNVPGVPPIAKFSYDPTFPTKGDNITFAGGASFDPDNPSAPNHGTERYLWIFGDGVARPEGENQTHIFSDPFTNPLSGNFTVILLVWDSDDNLPGVTLQVVDVAQGIAHSGSYNWSGYAVATDAGSVTDVRGSWIVPGIVGDCGPLDQHSSFWVGIDGLFSPTVEQVGTESACIKGAPTYFAWYEFFPHAAQRIPAMKLKPGDSISAEVNFSAGKFNLTLQDITLGASFSKLGKVKGAQLSSAEWIAEAPSNRTGILPLANFGTVKFGYVNTGIPGTCTATVNGVNRNIGAFGSRLVQITMASPRFFIKAIASDLSTDLTSFNVRWINQGP